MVFNHVEDSMEQIVESLVSLAVLAAVVWAVARAVARFTLAPIHAKLDRLIEMQERGTPPTI